MKALMEMLDEPITQRAFAEIVGLSEARVSTLAKEGLLEKGESGADWISAYCEKLRIVAAGRAPINGEIDPRQEKAMLDRSRREGQDIKNAVARGEYAPIELLTHTLSMAAVAVVDRFDQLENMVRKSCPDLSSAQLQTIQRVIANARNSWVQGTSKLLSDQLDELAGDDNEARPG